MSEPAPLLPRLRKAISDAYYGTRNDGGTMDQAADRAALACEKVVSLWLAEHATQEPA